LLTEITKFNEPPLNKEAFLFAICDQRQNALYCTGKAQMAFFFVENTPEQKKNDYAYLQPVMMFYAKVTSWIIAPVGIAILVIRITKRDDLFFIAVITGFLITIYGIYREIKKYKQDLEKQENKQNGNK
jgi:hypothetical protein